MVQHIPRLLCCVLLQLYYTFLEKGIERDKRYCNSCDENEIGTEQRAMIDCNDT